MTPCTPTGHVWTWGSRPGEFRYRLEPGTLCQCGRVGWKGKDAMNEYYESLQDTLEIITLLDKAHLYTDRNRAIIKAVHLAHLVGYEAGFRIDPDEPEWPVAVIELPTGQTSWHIEPHPTPWDGHTTEQKYERVRAFCEPAGPVGDGGQDAAQMKGGTE